MKDLEEKFQKNTNIKKSGPIKIADCDCHNCDGPSSLNSETCRLCIFKGMAGESRIDQVILRRSIKKIYPTAKVSKLANVLGMIKNNIVDQSNYLPSDPEKRCFDCAERRKEKMHQAWIELLKNPHDFSALDVIKEEEANKESKKCRKCTEENFHGLIRRIKKSLRGLDFYKDLGPKNYEDVFNSIKLPFFVEGVWYPPKKNQNS